MGLDMYAKCVPSNAYDTEVDFIADTRFKEDLMYWRKHNALHGWMEALYREKGGTEEFNCANVNLTYDDLDRLEKDVLGKNLPETSGFFFGEDSRYDEYAREQDMDFIMKAKLALSEGHKVYYTSWW